MKNKSTVCCKKVLKDNLEYLRKNYNVKVVGIFGSTVKGKSRTNSDIDILVELEPPIGFFKFIKLENFLKRKLGKKVDLVSKSALKPIIKDAVLKEVVYI